MKYVYTCKHCGVATVTADGFLRCPVCGSGEFTYKPYVEPKAETEEEPCVSCTNPHCDTCEWDTCGEDYWKGREIA